MLLTLSLTLQLLAAGLALRLIRITGHRLGWILVAAAITLMALRRAITLARLLWSDTAPLPDLDAELVALAISVCMLAGVALLTPFLRAARESREILQMREESLRQLTEATDELFWLVELEPARVVHMGPACDRILGVPLAAASRAPGAWHGMVHAEDRARVEQAFTAALGSGTLDELFRIVRRDDAIRWIHERAFHVVDARGRPYRLAGVVHDVTRRRELEAGLQQSQKLEAVGRLAGGIAHDFNNVLTAILGNAELLEAMVEDDRPDRRERLAQGVGEVRRAALRAAALTRQLLTFSRRSVTKPEVIDANATIAGIEDMLRRLLGEDVVLRVELAEAPCVVSLSPGQLEQVVMNLVVNARDAMPLGGEIRITTAVSTEASAGAFVVVAVSDTGEGMDAETRARIFEPFFTTKPLGVGTGLGLTTVATIAGHAGGRVEVDSAIGSGSAFRVWLPAVEAKTPTAAPAPARTARGHGTVLVCEDDPQVRELSSRVLEQASFRVLRAGSGDQALALAAATEGPIDLLVTDVVLPGINGKRLAETLREQHPELRVLYVSGYTADVIEHRGQLGAGVDLLEKPFEPRDLIERVRAALAHD